LAFFKEHLSALGALLQQAGTLFVLSSVKCAFHLTFGLEFESFGKHLIWIMASRKQPEKAPRGVFSHRDKAVPGRVNVNSTNKVKYSGAEFERGNENEMKLR